MISPVTVKLFKVPTAEIFGCVAVTNVPAIVVAVNAERFPIEVIPAMVPGDKIPLKVPPAIVPVTERLVSVPSEVILG